MLSQLPNNKKLILFDGVCNLCNSSVVYVIEHDKKDIFRFASLQSQIGQKLMADFNIDPTTTDSVILFSNESGVDIKSSAVLKIAAHLGFPQNLLVVFKIIPAFIRNWFYDYIAKNRYSWYGKRNECIVPTPELNKKFI